MTTVRSTDDAKPDRTAVPLSRNRHYNILWSGQLLSEIAIEVAAVAFPLLILARSGSPLLMGLASSLSAAVGMLAMLPAGLLADRWDRRWLMLACQAGRVLGMLSLVVALVTGWYSVWHVVAVMALDALLSTVFDPAEHAALPQVVPASQLPAAVSRNTARPFVAGLLGPALAGVLFQVGPVTPFVANAGMLLVAVVALVFLRLPRAGAATDTSEEPASANSWWSDVVVGLRWVAGRPVLRDTLAWVAVSNMMFSALVLIILARAEREAVAPGLVGVMMTCLGVGGLLGAALAPRLQEHLPPRASILGFSWIAVGATALMALAPAGIWLGVLLGLTTLLAPAANTTVLTYQMTITPDELRGRLSSIAGFCSGGAGVLGPAAGGLLLTAAGGPGALWWCSATLAVVAVLATIAPGLRQFRKV